jgi:broad specificity phosphatase PhoE
LATRVEVRPTAKTRARRRRRRFFTLLVYAAVVFVLAWVSESQGTTTVIFVRHADIDQSMAKSDAMPINERGRQRAEYLADLLQNVDVVAGVDAIYVDKTKRTQQTAEPLARRLGINYEVADPKDVVGFMKTVLKEHKREIVLVITHRDDIAPLIAELHGSKKIAEIAPDDYNEIFYVSIPWFGKVKTLQGRITNPPL